MLPSLVLGLRSTYTVHSIAFDAKISIFSPITIQQCNFSGVYACVFVFFFNVFVAYFPAVFLVFVLIARVLVLTTFLWTGLTVSVII